MKTDELREAYLEFFASKGCIRRPSDLLVPNDPTVLFTPAGMNQFKREFMGLGDPRFTRATTCQKCLRTGDIDNVGRTPFHETFFEMLGNFSFGDYFKREAIHWAWEFLTQTLRLAPNLLSVTVYLDDDEAYNIWRDEIKVPAGRISRMGEDDNFWPAGAPTHGPNGVCGPCSEIFYHGVGDKEVEIWNLVFTQFNRIGPGVLEPLPKKNIDTGMGLERAAACLQGVGTVFEIDVFRPIVAAAADALGVVYDAQSPDGVRIRRMADHTRALVFAIHENVRPGPEMQGYVIRRLLRRAVLDAYHMGRREPFLHLVAPVVAQAMSQPYPELLESASRVATTIKQEEEQFLANLENGLGILDRTFKKTLAAGDRTVTGKDAFTLHATYGIPVEVVESLASEAGLKLDRAGFEAERKRHAEISRGSTEAAAVFSAGPLDALRAQYPSGSEFLGYTSTTAEGQVLALVAGDQLVKSVRSDELEPDSTLALVLDRSPFYGEAGGQVGDTGVIKGDHFLFEVVDTRRDHDFILHHGRLVQGRIEVGDRALAEVDAPRRQAIRRAHSATHLLHHALHVVLGKHAQQAGSKVEPDRLRFDFSNPEAVGRDRLAMIEDQVNRLILDAAPVVWSRMPLEQARQSGAMALFGEKYPDIVRVVQMGDYSRELCGGTHLDNVAQVGLFKIVGEESVASGTRRITALTGAAAVHQIRDQDRVLGALAETLRVPAGQLVNRVSALLEEIKTLKKQASARPRDAGGKLSADDLLARTRTIGTVHAVIQNVEQASVDELRQLIDVLRRKRPEGLAVLLASSSDGKVTLTAGFTPDLVQRGLNAGAWLKEVAPVVGGGGGGRPDMATAGGKIPEKIPAALEAAAQYLETRLTG